MSAVKKSPAAEKKAQAGKKALGMFTISDHILTGEALNAMERQTTFDQMMKIALETAVKMDM